MSRSVLGLLLLAAAAGSLHFDGGGYWKSYGLCVLLPDEQPLEAGAWNGILRAESRADLSGAVKLRAEIMVLPSVRDNRLADTGRSTGLRISDPDRYLYPDRPSKVGSFALMTDLDRLSLSLGLPVADIIVGRQAIAWGSAHIISPTDFLAPFPFNEIETEDRRGVDALRARIPMGLFSELDLGAVSGYHAEPDSSAAYARIHTYLQRTDIDLVLGVRSRDLTAGLSTSRAVGGASAWLDAAATSLGGPSGRSGETMLRASVGTDYRLAADVYGQIEYHYSSHARDQLPEHPNVHLNANHYLTPGIAWQVSPLLTVAPTALINIREPSTYIMTSLDYSFAQNAFLGAGAHLSLGADGGDDLGSYPDLFYTSASFYF